MSSRRLSSLIPPGTEDRARLTAGLVSFAAGTVILLAKLVAFSITGSSAILSDSLEGIVNVVAALFAVGSILFAGRPADRGHPYGHGKIEFFSAAFEGGLISFAAVGTGVAAVRALIEPHPLRSLDMGLAIIAAAGVGNALLGLHLIRAGKKTKSLILLADGHHVLSDFWTTAGVILGLLLVRATGIRWIDPLVALVVAANLARTGFKLVRQSARALLDEEDTQLLQSILEAGEAARRPGIIRLHHLRAIRVGRFVHIDAHLVVPEFWTVLESHDFADEFERRLMERGALEGEVAFHNDPCRRLYCQACDLPECGIRVKPFAHRPSMTLEEATQPDPPPGESLRLPFG